MYVEGLPDFVAAPAVDERRRLAQDRLVEHRPVAEIRLVEQRVLTRIDTRDVLAHEAPAVDVDIDLPWHAAFGVVVETHVHGRGHLGVGHHAAEIGEVVLAPAQITAGCQAHAVTGTLAERVRHLCVVPVAAHFLEQGRVRRIPAAREQHLAGLVAGHTRAVLGDHAGNAAIGGLDQLPGLRAVSDRHIAGIDMRLDLALEHIHDRDAPVAAPVIPELGIRFVRAPCDRVFRHHVETRIHEPVERIGGVPDRELHEILIDCAFADADDVVVVLLGRVLDALGRLHLGAGCAHLAHGEQQRAAEHIGGFEQQDLRSAPGGENRCGQPCRTAAYDDEIPGLRALRAQGR